MKITKELKTGIKDQIHDMEYYSAGYGHLSGKYVQIFNLKISIPKDTATYDVVFGDYEDKTRERMDDVEINLTNVLSKMNLKEYCPDKAKTGIIGKCPHMVNSDKYDLTKEPCMECLVFDGQ